MSALAYRAVACVELCVAASSSLIVERERTWRRLLNVDDSSSYIISHQRGTGTFRLAPWASTPLEHWGVACRAPKTRESRRRRRRGGWALKRGCAPSQKIYEFFVSKLCDMVHSGCVVFKIHVSHGL